MSPLFHPLHHLMKWNIVKKEELPVAKLAGDGGKEAKWEKTMKTTMTAMDTHAKGAKDRNETKLNMWLLSNFDVPTPPISNSWRLESVASLHTHTHTHTHVAAAASIMHRNARGHQMHK